LKRTRRVGEQSKERERAEEGVEVSSSSKRTAPKERIELVSRAKKKTKRVIGSAYTQATLLLAENLLFSS